MRFFSRRSTQALHRRKRSTPYHRPLGLLEMLEDRTLMAVNISIGDASATEGQATARFIDIPISPQTSPINFPKSITRGPDGDFYVVSSNTNSVLRYDRNTLQFVETFISSGSGGLWNPIDLAFANGRLFVSSANNDSVLQYDGITGSFIGAFVQAGAFGIDRPTDLLVHEGSLYVGALDSDDVHRYDLATGNFIERFVNPHAGGLTDPLGMAFGPDGNLYVGSLSAVLRYDGVTGDFIDEFLPSGAGGLSRPFGLRFGPDRNFYVSDFERNGLMRYASDTGEFIDTFIIPEGLYGRLLFTDNRVFVTSGGTEIVRFQVESWAAFTVTLASPSDSVVSVNYSTADGSAIAGSDYAATSGTIEFAPGETLKTIVILTLDDVVAESSETFTVNLSNALGATIADGQGVGTIQDNGQSGPSISISDLTITEGINPQAAISVELSFAATAPVTVDYSTADGTAIAGLDYAASTGSLTFEPGQNRRTILVPILDDSVFEPIETFTVSLSNAVGATIADGQAIGTIQDNDPFAPSLSISDVTVLEGAVSAATFTLRLNVPSPSPVTVNYATADGTALAGINYVATTGTLNFAPGETQRSIIVPILNDGTTYASESFTLNLSNAVGAAIVDAQAVGTIEDHDPSDFKWTLRASTNGQVLETYLSNPVSPGQTPLTTWPMNSLIPFHLSTDDILDDYDAIFVELPPGSDGPLGGILLDTQRGDNELVVKSGHVRIDSISTGGVLNTTIEPGAELITSHLNQNGLTVAGGGRVTILPGGQTSKLTALDLAAGASLDIADNALVVDYTGASPAAAIRQRILAGRGSAGFGASWTGPGIHSSEAAQANLTDPEAWSIAYAENAALPLGPYTTFRGESVDDTSILIAYNRTGDANLDGLVNDDDVTILGATYAPGVAQPQWSLGDFDYNGFVDDDDVTLLGAFYNPSAAPQSPVPLALTDTATPARWLHSGDQRSPSISSDSSRNQRAQYLDAATIDHLLAEPDTKNTWTRKSRIKLFAL